ncbi:MAG: hypothetical protein HZA16_11640, partial [Nitrospirae bacterium]|nr:hypothetical protein [Nitrospirota bacterium]
MSTFDFAHSGCAWCHPGGGALEYDRAGYRFDGAAGLSWTAGSNPAPGGGDYFIYGIQAGAASVDGGGFYALGTAGLYDPAVTSVINQGTMKVDSTGTVVGKVYKNWTAASGGVAEADCLMCHYSNQYANLERNYAFPAATAPKLAASLGLVGAGTGQTGLLAINTKGSAGINPNPDPTTWTGWSADVADITNFIVSTPKRENCALCHFPDKSMAGTPDKTGPSSKPLGYTAFQKYMAAGAAVDGDELIGVNGQDGKNNDVWNAVKGRVEGGKRAESINDANNPDAHMKTLGQGMSCTDCHYLIEGSFPALMSGSTEIQPAMNVLGIDHQFAKGNNAPDGKNMDQLDNTVTCGSCHIDGTHPNAAGAPDPTAAHAVFPQLHFDKIDCKTCHIPVLNAPMKQQLADFTAGPWRTFERAQITENAAGVNIKPLYMWRATEHDGSGLQIEPIMTMSVAIWGNGTAFDGSGFVTSFGPTYQRAAKKGAELLRAQYGDGNADGIYDFRLNDAADKALVINTETETSDMVAIMRANGINVAEPFQHFYFNQFAVSHNVLPKASQTASKAILGSAVGGGCVMCHSSSNPSSPDYSLTSVGFFDKSHSLFTPPTGGLQQTFVDGKARVNVKFPYKKPDGASASITLHSVTAGGVTANAVGQGEVLGYDSARLAALQNLDNCAACHTATDSTNHHDGTCTSCHSAGALNGLERHDGAVPSTDNASCIECHGSKTLDLSGMAL